MRIRYHSPATLPRAAVTLFRVVVVIRCYWTSSPLLLLIPLVLWRLPLLAVARRDHGPCDPVSVVPTTIAMGHSFFGIYYHHHPSRSFVDTIRFCSVNSIVQSSHHSSSWSSWWDDSRWGPKSSKSSHSVAVSIATPDWDSVHGGKDLHR